MSRTAVERELCNFFVGFPDESKLRYTPETANILIQKLFKSLVGFDDQSLPLLFPKGAPPARPSQRWHLQDAQEMEEGAEYSEAARGHACGHIFQSGEASYRCRTCTNDDTCALCAKCFESTDHEGHTVYVLISPGNSGCCDCGDDEAWIKPLLCSIHSHLPGTDTGSSRVTKPAELPREITECIRGTISQALDYICDVFSCTPEQVKASFTEASVRRDERMSRLYSRFSNSPQKGSGEDDDQFDDPNCEFALAVWHDEKHTVPDVQNQIARACNLAAKTARKYTLVIEEVGRYVVRYSPDLPDLLARASIIEAIGLTVTVRSSRDVFREEMCGTIIEWLHDIIGCTVGGDSNILRNIICEELLAGWREGSKAHNLVVGRDGIQDNTPVQRSPRLGRFYLTVDGQLETEPVEAETLMDDASPNVLRDFDDVEMVFQIQQDHDHDDRDDDVDLDDHQDYQRDGLESDHTDNDTVMDVRPGSRNNERNTQSASKSKSARSSEYQFPIPKTPLPIKKPPNALPPPPHWIQKTTSPDRDDLSACGTTSRRLRLDYLILFDIRMWKILRISVREILIGTVVSLPAFKRLLGLRFAGLYSVLAQLYLIADREPDLSIINLSLQMLTSPSITNEMVERKNFLSNLLAILMTFMTSRQVGYPGDIDPLAVLPLDQGTVTNRRMYHFFIDLRYLLASPQVHQTIRQHPEYLMQFLDLIKLAQGIYPAVRAVDEHVEYETDLWLTAFTVTREINKSCRLFCDAYAYTEPEDLEALSSAIRMCAKFAIVNSIGAEMERFVTSEIKRPVEFINFPTYEFSSYGPPSIQVVNFDVSSEPMSFHHPLHYMLSWIIERGKHLSADELRKLLEFSQQGLVHPPVGAVSSIIHLSPHQYLLALFDTPIRILTWMAQMRSGLWVRNGISLRQQMMSYLGAPQREVGYNRDVFLLQVAFSVCDPTTILATLIQRFGLVRWVSGAYEDSDNRGEDKVVEIVEDFVHLLIIVLSDRLLLLPPDYPQDFSTLLLRRDIAHSLCFKPLSYSEISSRVPEKFHGTTKFEEALRDVAVFKAPESVMENGLYELKKSVLEEIDPYVAQYNKNQREEAESLYRAHISKMTGRPVEEIVMEPKLPAIQSGPFVGIAAFVHSPLFAEIIFRLLSFVKDHQLHYPTLAPSKVEWLLNFVLHLLLIALREDTSVEGQSDGSVEHPLSELMLTVRSGGGTPASIAGILLSLRDGEFASSAPKINLLLLRLRGRWPQKYSHLRQQMNLPEQDDVKSVSNETAVDEKERKKQLAKERQAKIMAQFKQRQSAFMQAQNDWDDDDLEDQDDDRMEVDVGHERTWKYPEDNCIMCQEKTGPDKLFGIFAFCSSSTNFRQTDTSDPKWLAEVRDTPDSLDRDAQAIRPFGVAGQNKKMTEKIANDGSKVMLERQGLSDGFPMATHSQTEHVVTGCGHIMHYFCFANYLNATRQRHFTQIARLQPERSYLNEFTCPLCKALGNTFLPIIWKDKKIIDVSEIHPHSDFASFLEGLNKFDDHKPKELQKDIGILRDFMVKTSGYTNVNLSPWTVDVPPMPFAPGDPGSPGISGISSGSNHILENYLSVERVFKGLVPPNQPPVKPYNPLYSSCPGPNPDIEFLHLLICALGSSMASIEVSQRGVASDTKATYLDNIPSQTITTLRVLSETVMTVSSIRMGVYSAIEDKQDQLMKELSGAPDPREFTPDFYRPRSVLAQDPFHILTQVSFFLVQMKGTDLHSVVKLLYIVEIVRTVLTCASVLRTRTATEVNQFASSEKIQSDPAADQALLELAKIACARFQNTLAIPNFDQVLQQALPFIRTMVSTYSLAFLRKVIILLNVVHGIEFPRNQDLDPNAPEMFRLETILQLPPLQRLFSDTDGGPLVAPALRTVVQNWSDRLAGLPARVPSLSFVRMSHPAIPELIGLPRIYDVLIEETMKRKCPNSGRKLTDPAICLYCGEIFCSQASCCTRESNGGCSQHLAKCGKSTGIFLNIRKCMVIMLHSKHGSFFLAPYLDKHSESDPALRRQQQLFLNQHRYDVLLRTVWLNHGVASMIARRLESEVNTGGWETL